MRLPPVLILTYVYPPDNYSGAARPHRLAKYLARIGHPVFVLAAGTEDTPMATGNVHRVRGELDHLSRWDAPALIERVIRKFVLRYDEGATWMWRAITYARRWRRERPVLLSTSPPLSTHMAAWWMKNEMKLSWLADFRDPLMGNPARKWPLQRRIDAWLEPWIFRNADLIIGNTDVAAEAWRERWPEFADKITVLWNGFDPDDATGPRAIPPREWKALTHVGTIYPDRHPGLVLDSLVRLSAAGHISAANFRLRLFGPAAPTAFPRPDSLEKLTKAGLLEYRPGKIPQAEAQAIVCESDYLLLLDLVRGQRALQVPAKLFDYVRIGRPILSCTARNSPVERILQQSGVPFRSISADMPSEEVDRAVMELLRMPSDATPPSEWFQKTFHAEEQALWLSRHICEVAEQGKLRRCL